MLLKITGCTLSKDKLQVACSCSIKFYKDFSSKFRIKYSTVLALCLLRNLLEQSLSNQFDTSNNTHLKDMSIDFW